MKVKKGQKATGGPAEKIPVFRTMIRSAELPALPDN
jgi:hypothetical protein